MGTPPIGPERSQRLKDAVEKALRQGYTPFRVSGGKGSAPRKAVLDLVALGYPETNNKINSFIKHQEKLALRGEDNYLPDWSLYAPAGVTAGEVKAGKVHRWLVSSAQDDTDVHPKFWANLQAYAKYVDAEILIGGFTYQTRRHSDRTTLTNTFRSELKEYLRFDPVDLGPVLFCADMNTLPTAARPLSGLLSYSRGRDALFPHAKLAYQTAPAVKGEHAPSLMTTGAVTVPNYVEKKAGKKAEFHHILGATMVEVDDTGSAWCRSISAMTDGSFQDLETLVRDGRISGGHRIEGVTFGDLHVPSVEPHVADWLWGHRADSLMDSLKPRYAFIHDLVALEAHSRWVEKDPFHHATMVAAGHSVMEHQITLGAQTLRDIEREFCQPVVIYSNHDDRILQWSKANPKRDDTSNIMYWHKCNLAFYQSLQDNDKDFDLFRWALKEADPHRLEGIGFVPRGGSFAICQDAGGGGIECGMHGDLGPNGARGSSYSFSRMASRMTIGHTHTPEIHDGVYVAGLTGDLDQGYNKGPGSWRRAHVIVYPNGKRTIITQNNQGRWRA